MIPAQSHLKQNRQKNRKLKAEKPLKKKQRRKQKKKNSTARTHNLSCQKADRLTNCLTDFCCIHTTFSCRFRTKCILLSQLCFVSFRVTFFLFLTDECIIKLTVKLCNFSLFCPPETREANGTDGSNFE